MSCPTTTVDVSSPCGFKSFTTTCASAPSCSGNVCKLEAAKAETCTISMVLGDGTAHTAQVTTSAATPNDGCGSCFAGVDHVMLDGKPAGTLLTLASATCGAALDAASGDAQGE